MRLARLHLRLISAATLVCACLATLFQLVPQAAAPLQPVARAYPTVALATETTHALQATVPTRTLTPTDGALDPAHAAQSNSVGAMARGDLARTGFYAARAVEPPLAVAWQAILADGIFTTPALVGATLYVASGNGTIYALDRTSGAIKWQQFTGDWVLASPAVAHGLVAVLNRSGALLAFDAHTGAALWTQQLDGEGYASPLIADGLLYTASSGGSVYAFDTRSGQQRWRMAVKGGVFTPPALAEGRLFVGTQAGAMYALDAASGTEQWQQQLGSPLFTAPAVADGRVLIGSSGGQLYALDAASGREQWQYTAGAAVSAPAVANGRAFVISQDGIVHAVVSDSGAALWRFAVEGRVYSVDLLAPVVAGESVYVGSDNDEGQSNSALYLLDTASGRQLVRYNTKAAVRSSPALADATLYVGDALGTLYALHSANN